MKQKLGFLSSYSLMINQIIGFGIFMTPGIVLYHCNDILSYLMMFLFCGFITLLSVLCYLELGLLYVE